MAGVEAMLQDLVEKETVLDLVYNSYDTQELSGLSPKQLQSIYEDLRHVYLSIPQIKASIKYMCAYPFLCDREELLDVLKEMDRRFYLAKDLQWEFALLDRQRKGAISVSDVKFLFESVYGDFFSKYKFERMIQSRIVTDSDISFNEIEVELCNIPTYEWMEELYAEENREKEENEFKKREEERKRKEKIEQQQKEEEMKRQLEEEDRKMREKLAKRKKEEEEKEEAKRKEEEDKRSKEKEAEDRRKTKEAEDRRKTKEREKVLRAEAERNKQEQDEKEREEEARLKAEQENLMKAEAERQRKEEGERLKAEQEELMKAEAERQRKEEEERLKAEQEELVKAEAERQRKEEEERLKAEQEELVKAEEVEKLQSEETGKAEEEESKREAEKNKMNVGRALQNWSLAKNAVKEKMRQNRLKAVHEAKAKRDAKEAEKEEEDADAAEEAENKAEEELAKAEVLLLNATSEDEKKEAEGKIQEAQKEALANREKRLRLKLRAAVKLRYRPKIDVTIVEATEAEIPALQPDIKVAESVSDSLKCGEELENAMVKRQLPEIETAIDKIKKKGYEKDHTIQLTDADKLVEKLKRLEKLKKEILALDQRTISEIRSYKTPIPAIHEIMIATYIILGYKEKELKEWKFIQALLGRTGKEGLKRMVTTLEASKVDLSVASIAEKKYLSKHDLATITDVSAGAATFYVWSTAMIDEARSWHEDSEFRKKVEEKRKQEEDVLKKLQETQKTSKKTSQKDSKSINGKRDAKTAASSVKKNLKPELKSTPPTSRRTLPTTPGNARSKTKSPTTARKKK